MRPERAIAAQLSLAQKQGADVRLNETVFEINACDSGVAINSDNGICCADCVIVAVGAWLPKVLGSDFEKLLKIHRQVLHWFSIDGDIDAYVPSRFPVFIWELPETRQGIYGFPAVDGAGLKIATEQYDATADPQSVDRDVTSTEIAAMYQNYVAPHLRGVTSRSLKAATCLYTVTPDAGFILDRLPSSDRVIVASCCSGHGFKHSAAVGEILADMAQGSASPFDLVPFRLGRFRI